MIRINHEVSTQKAQQLLGWQPDLVILTKVYIFKIKVLILK